MSQPDFKLSSQLKVGPICLRTGNLEPMLAFYAGDFGFKVLRNEGDYIAVGASSTSEPLIILHHDEKASKPPQTATGLYHYALLVPDRRSLASAYLSLGEKGVVFDGYADHHVSEALYLSDPEGNGIEIYSDRPREKWSYDEGGVQMTAQPLDLDSLIKELPSGAGDSTKPLADGTAIGHVHLKVSNLETSIAYYRDVLGFEVTRHWGSAAFLSAGRYHHHIGMNTWESLEGEAASKSWTGMEYISLRIPETDLTELSHRLGINPTTIGGRSKQLFVADPDNLNLIFQTL